MEQEEGGRKGQFIRILEGGEQVESIPGGLDPWFLRDEEIITKPNMDFFEFLSRHGENLHRAYHREKAWLELEQEDPEDGFYTE